VYVFARVYSRHAAVSVDANPLPSPERSTTASESQQCPVVVVLNEHRPKDAATSSAQPADECRPLGDSSHQVAVNSNKTGLVATVTQVSSSLSPRPICPNLPYSPSCSPRFARRRPPLRDCRVSVNVQSLDDPNVHQKLNQYKLIDSIGQVRVLGLFFLRTVRRHEISIVNSVLNEHSRTHGYAVLNSVIQGSFFNGYEINSSVYCLIGFFAGNIYISILLSLTNYGTPHNL